MGIEAYNLQQPVLPLNERTMVEHFHESHRRDNTRRYIVQLPMKMNVTPLGVSRSLTARGFKGLECSLRVKTQFHEYALAM